MDLSVVIPARNEEGTIARQLQALLGQEWDGDWEVVVVDNGSTDGTASVVERMAQEHPRLRLIAETEPGISSARNAGIAASTAVSVAFCDADDIVADGWVAAIGGALAEHQLVSGALEAEVLNPAWIASSRGTRSRSALSSFYGALPYPSGNNFGARRELFERLGGFRQEFLGAEDLEFAVRARAAGVNTVFVPGAIVHYAYRQTRKELWAQGFSYGLPRPRVAKMLEDLGFARPKPFAGWKSWAWLTVNSWRVFSATGRARLAWVAGNRCGHLVGSIRARTLLL